MIRVEELFKSYGAMHAVDGISFHVPAGTIYGLLGPNGAGKTTTISCISGLLKPNSGRVTIDGIDLGSDPIRARQGLGVVPQETAIYDTLTAAENVSYFASLHGMAGATMRTRVNEVLERVGLEPGSKQQSRKFSGGMKRRLNLAIGLVSRPHALLLDEPTVGIDPQARLNILEVVRDTVRQGTAILYTTHYLEEAETLCDRVGIVDHGRILAEGTVDELRRTVGEGTVVTIRGRFTADAFRAAMTSGTKGGPGGDPAAAAVKIVTLEDDAAMIAVSGGRGAASELLAAVVRAGIDVAEISMQEPSLQNVFIKLTGRELRD
jgi:ABC-2 type transport system ATP-binding protein